MQTIKYELLHCKGQTLCYVSLINQWNLPMHMHTGPDGRSLQLEDPVIAELTKTKILTTTESSIIFRYVHLLKLINVHYGHDVFTVHLADPAGLKSMALNIDHAVMWSLALMDFYQFLDELKMFL